MKKRISILATLLCLFIVSIAFAIPPTEDYCIEPDESVPSTAYCNNVSLTPTEIALWCQYQIGYLDQQKSCIGNLLIPIPN